MDPSLSTKASPKDPYDEKYVRHDQGYPDLGRDLLSLKLDNCWEDNKYDHVDEWMTVEEFCDKYEEVFDNEDLTKGLALMKNAALKSRAAILANNLELPYQLYARLVGHVSEYEIIQKYLSSLIKLEALSILPLGPFWPHLNHPCNVVHYNDSEVETVCWIRDEDKIVFADRTGTVHIYSLDKGQVINTLRGHEGRASSLCVSGDGRKIVSGSYDTTVRVWDTSATSSPAKVLKGHKKPVTSVGISQSGRWIVSGSPDGTVRVWNTIQSSAAEFMVGHTDRVSSVSISSYGQWIVSGSHDGTVRLWNTIAGPKSVKILKINSTPVTSVSISHNGRWISCGSLNMVIVWTKTAHSISKHVLKGHTNTVRSVSISHDGRWIISGSNDNTIRMWDTSVANLVYEKALKGHSAPVKSASISHDGRWIMSGSEDRTIRMWDTRNVNQMYEKVLEEHLTPIRSVNFSPCGRWFVSGSYDGTVGLWDINESQMPVKIFKGHGTSAVSVSISLDGQWIVSTDSSIVLIWDRSSGFLRFVIICQQEVTSVQFKLHAQLTIAFRTDNSVTAIISNFGVFGEIDSITQLPERVHSQAFLRSVLRRTNTDFEMRHSHALEAPFSALSGTSSRISAVTGASSSAGTIHFSSSSARSNLPNASSHTTTYPSISSIVSSTSSTMRNTRNSHSMTPHGPFGRRTELEQSTDKNSATIKRRTNDNFKWINREDNIGGSGNGGDKNITTGIRNEKRSTYSVKVFAINHDAIRSRPSQTTTSEHVTMSGVPFYCKGDFIYKSDSNTRLARLPAPVLNELNSVTYSEESKTLAVFLQNNMTCFFRLKEQQHELALDDFMELRADIFGTSISASDKCLFNYFKQSSSRIRMMNSCTFLDQYSDGLFLGSISDENIPKRDNVFKFRYMLSDEEGNDKEMLLMVDPYALTPLGLSIIFWLLPITPTNHKVLKGIMKKMKLNNCFCREVTGEEGRWYHTALVIPQAWALEYELDNNFIVKHSVIGKFGICIGMGNASSKSSHRIHENTVRSYNSRPLRSLQSESRHGLLSWVRRSNILAILEIVIRERDESKTENQPLRGKLLYREYSNQKWVLKNMDITFNTPFFDAGFEIGPMENSVDLSSFGQPVELRSLNMFIAMDMVEPHNGLYNRMKWFEKVLSKIGSFPSDEKRGFLEQILKEIRDGHPIELLESCSVKAGSLRRTGCLQLETADAVHVLVPLPISERQYLAFTGKINNETKVIEVDTMVKKEVRQEELKDKSSHVTFELW